MAPTAIVTKKMRKLESQCETLKKDVVEQKKEIDRLTRDCVDYEDQCEALKKEVAAAWKTYKGAQEQAWPSISSQLDL